VSDKDTYPERGVQTGRFIRSKLLASLFPLYSLIPILYTTTTTTTHHHYHYHYYTPPLPLLHTTTTTTTHHHHYHYYTPPSLPLLPPPGLATHRACVCPSLGKTTAACPRGCTVERDTPVCVRGL